MESEKIKMSRKETHSGGLTPKEGERVVAREEYRVKEGFFCFFFFKMGET